MIRRAKFSVLFILVGALTASGAGLNLEQRHPAFQPGRKVSLAQPAVMKPAQATSANRMWPGTKELRRPASTPAAVKVEPNAKPLARAADATVVPGAGGQAGGRR